VRRDERHARLAVGFWIARAFKEAKIVQINCQKATTALRARARLQPPDFDSITDGAEIVVGVSVVDKSGAEVVHADITCWVTPV
jgi:uncharacterized protein DUF4442